MHEPQNSITEYGRLVLELTLRDYFEFLDAIVPVWSENYGHSRMESIEEGYLRVVYGRWWGVESKGKIYTSMSDMFHILKGIGKFRVDKICHGHMSGVKFLDPVVCLSTFGRVPKCDAHHVSMHGRSLPTVVALMPKNIVCPYWFCKALVNKHQHVCCALQSRWIANLFLQPDTRCMHILTCHWYLGNVSSGYLVASFVLRPTIPYKYVGSALSV